MQIYKFTNNLFASFDDCKYLSLFMGIEPKYILVMNNKELGSFRSKYIFLSSLPIQIISQDSIYTNIYNFELQYILMDFLPNSLRGESSNNELKEKGYYTYEVFKNNNRLINRLIEKINIFPSKEEDGIKNILLLSYISQIIKFKEINNFNVGSNLLEDLSNKFIEDYNKRNYYLHLSEAIKQYLNIVRA